MDTPSLKNIILKELPLLIQQDEQFYQAILKIVENNQTSYSAVTLTEVVKNLEKKFEDNEQKWLENQKQWTSNESQIAAITTAIQTLDRQLHPEEDEDLTIRPF